MGKGHASLDLKLEETSNAAYGFGINVAGCSEAGRGTGCSVNPSLEVHPLYLSAPYRVAGRVCSEELLWLTVAMNGSLISAPVSGPLSELTHARPDV